MKKRLYENGLSLALIALFLLCMAMQALVGWRDYNQDQLDHKEPTVGFGSYLRTGHFQEAVFENWESEFLQMALFVFLTEKLRQRGSAESRKLKDEEEEEKKQEAEVEEKARREGKVPWPVRRGGFVLKLYENSLFTSFVLLFAFSFAMHGVGGLKEYNEEQVQLGKSAVGLGGYMTSSRFWFESMQNWQSEFLAVLAVVVFSIWLRAKHSSQSKPVGAAHDETGH